LAGVLAVIGGTGQRGVKGVVSAPVAPGTSRDTWHREIQYAVRGA